MRREDAMNYLGCHILAEVRGFFDVRHRKSLTL